MKNRTTYLICFFVIIAALITTKGVFSRDEQSLQNRFKHEEPKAWLDYLNHLRTIRVTASYSFQCPGGSYSDVTEIDRIIALPYILTESTTTSSLDSEPVYSMSGANPRYRFSLNKNNAPESGNSVWTVGDIKKTEKKDASKEYRFPGLDAANSDLSDDNNTILLLAEALKVHFQFFLPSLYNSEDFEIISVTEEEEDGQKLAHIVYRHEPENVEGIVGPTAIRSGELWLIPSQSWVIKRASVNLLDAGERTDRLNALTTIEYEDADDPYPFPQSTKTVLTNPDTDKTEAIFFNQFTATRDFRIPDKKEFYLSHYGIPEPKFEGDHDWRRHAFVLLGLAIIAAAYLAYQRRRKSV